ncbi:metal-dependent hydrolase [Endozoicomonadaceae bacterium StTr2]
MLAGALLGTLPDLDVLIDYGDDISNTVKHRGFSHSLLILPLFSLLLTWLIHKFKPLPQWSFGRLLALITLALVTHPLLDNFTSYGTQLLWPLPGYFSLSSVFIIDPLYTLPLLVAMGFALINNRLAARYCTIALLLSSAYLGWTLVAKQLVEQRAQESLQALGIPQDKVFITPSPLNTVLWRIVVVDGDHYWEGLTSFLDSDSRVRFVQKPRGHWPLLETPEQLQAYRNFTGGFIRYRIENNQLIVSDLRLGLPDNLAFQFRFADREAGGQWQLHTPERSGSIRFESGTASKLFARVMGDNDPLSSDCLLCASR